MSVAPSPPRATAVLHGADGVYFFLLAEVERVVVAPGGVVTVQCSYKDRAVTVRTRSSPRARAEVKRFVAAWRTTQQAKLEMELRPF